MSTVPRCFTQLTCRQEANTSWMWLVVFYRSVVCRFSLQNSLHFIHKLSSQGLLLFWGELESVVVADLSPCLYNFQNLAKAYKDFEGLSGKYTAFLIVGDPIIRTPLNWPFVSELLSFIIYHCVIVICCSAV